jgi:hypothetical protein
MKKLLDYNPLTGQKTYFQTQAHEDTFRIVTETDDSASALDYASERRADGNYTQKGIKGDMWHYAKLSAEAIMQLKSEDGIDILAPNYDKKRFFELLNTKYKRFKTTDKTHNVRR